MTYLPIIVLILFIPNAYAIESPLKDWRYPAEADRTGDWKTYEKDMPEPFHAESDFNGDGQIDHAWILFKTNENSWGLFVFLGNASGHPDIIKLDETDKKIQQAQSQGINLVKAGHYRTACGKGYGGGCNKGEPEILELILPGLSYFTFERASSIFFWNNKSQSFKRIWISD